VEEPSESAVDPAPERVGVHEICERERAVDLDGRKELPIARLELRPAADVDDLELERELSVDLLDDLQRPRAEAAVSRVIDRYVRNRSHSAAAVEQPRLGIFARPETLRSRISGLRAAYG
jgi:hypothetical protein